MSGRPGETAGDPALDRLRQALAGLTRPEAGSLLDEALEEARARARRVLTDVLVTQLVADAGREAEERTSPQRAAVSELLPDAGLPSSRGLAVYVYAVVRAGSPVPEGMAGVDPRSQVTVVRCGPLAALVSNVPLAEFGEAPLRRNLEDLAWLEEKATRHQSVLGRAVELTGVVPMRFCTIYDDSSRVEELLARHREPLLGALEGVEGKQEWGVKILYDGPVVAEAVEENDEEATALTGRMAEAGEGRAYFLRKKRDQVVAEAVERTVMRAAEQMHESLSGMAAASVAGPLQHRDLTGEGRDMALNGSYLVAVDAVPRFQAAVDELRNGLPRGVTAELTGPWPPYSFVRIDLSGDGPGERTAG